MKISKINSLTTYSNRDLRQVTLSDAAGFDSNRIVRKPSLEYGNRETFEPSEFNLYEIGIIEDVESYVRQAFQKKTALMFKEGEELRGKNKKTINYLKKRFRQIESVTDVAWRSLLRETGYYLISRSNFFWVIVRDEKASGGRRVNGKKPIAGFFPMPPETVQVKKDRKTGRIIKYKQVMPDGRTREFSPDNVVHFDAYKKSGFNFGTPAMLSVKDDIRALRRIEENIELLVYQNLFPIFHYKVGSDTKPAGDVRLPDGTVVDEVQYVRGQISGMPSEGGIVTPERHEIKFIGSEGKSLRAEGYLEYFKKRVFAGLGCSAVDFGEGETANRATADNMSRILVDSVKDYQDILAEQITHKILMPLMREASFNVDLFNEDNLVVFSFKEIDIETQLKKNVNAQLMYNGNLVDIHEGRKAAGLEPLESTQEKDMYSKRVTIPEMKIKTKSAELQTGMSIEAQMQAASQNAAVAAGTTTTKTSKSPTGGTSKSVTKVNKSVGNQVKAKSAPTNQFGTKTGPQKSQKDTYFADSLATDRWEQLKSDVLLYLNDQNFSASWVKTLVGVGLNDLRDRYVSIVNSEIFRGYRSLDQNPTAEAVRVAYSYFVDKLNSYFKVFNSALDSRLVKELELFESGSSKDLAILNITEIFDTMKFRLKFFNRTERTRAYNVGRAVAAKDTGRAFVEVKKEESCEECMSAPDSIELNPLVFDDVPPTHSNCTCKVVLSDFTPKTERCILKVKRQLRSDNPKWSEKRIKSAAIAICRSSVNK